MKTSLAGMVQGALLISFGAMSPCTAESAWVEQSNKHAQVLLAIQQRFNPESAAALGIEGLDEEIFDIKPGIAERRQQALKDALGELRKRLTAERHPLVRQDLQIMIEDTADGIRRIELNQKHTIPYFSMSGAIFGGMRALLDDQIAAKRRPAAVVRLRRYTGLEAGYTPATILAEQRIRERLTVPGLLGPARLEVERDLQNSSFFLQGIAQLFEKYKLDGWQEAHAKLKAQIAAYDSFVRQEILPRARTDFRLPRELYDFNLKQVGIDIPAEDLIKRAHAAFDDLQREMQALAPKVAKSRGWNLTDYREVIRELKKEQLSGDSILAHYRQRIGEIEQVIRREDLVTLPDRPARMRLATPAESAAQPAPNMRPPRLIGNTGESGEFVLPLVNPAAKGESKAMDDFTFAAASYTLTAHEARPGHEMQFSAMMERGVSIPRAVFAFNSTNVEGWGLYAEKIMFPYMPPDAQIISLNMRLLRAARAFLDPELHLGRITREQAYELLRKDVSMSDGMATQEVDRYTFRSPGQATAYFYGYTKLLALREEVERKMGPQFRAKAFHDFVLAQGLLPPELLREAVLRDFVK